MAIASTSAPHRIFDLLFHYFIIQFIKSNSIKMYKNYIILIDKLRLYNKIKHLYYIINYIKYICN